MSIKSLTLLIFTAVLLSFSPGAFAETWHLSGDSSWQAIPDTPQGRYMLAVANVKKLIATGDTESAAAALLKLQQEFTEIAGPDLTAFIEAETLYSQGKWPKAVKKYDDFLDAYPESWLYESALEREFSVAIAYLSGEKRIVLKFLRLSGFDDAATILRRIADRTGDAPIAMRAMIALASGQEKNSLFLDAYETWAEISIRWPTGDTGRDALWGMARSLHSAYKGPRYDSASLISAKSYYEKFKMLYPDHAVELNIDDKLTMIEEQIAYKQFVTGDYYSKAERFQAANLYFDSVLARWPETTAGKMAKTEIDFGPAAGAEGEKRTRRRRAFDAVSGFLDSWFGLAKLKSKEK